MHQYAIISNIIGLLSKILKNKYNNIFNNDLESLNKNKKILHKIINEYNIPLGHVNVNNVQSLTNNPVTNVLNFENIPEELTLKIRKDIENMQDTIELINIEYSKINHKLNLFIKCEHHSINNVRQFFLAEVTTKFKDSFKNELNILKLSFKKFKLNCIIYIHPDTNKDIDNILTAANYLYIKPLIDVVSQNSDDTKFFRNFTITVNYGLYNSKYEGIELSFLEDNF